MRRRLLSSGSVCCLLCCHPSHCHPSIRPDRIILLPCNSSLGTTQDDNSISFLKRLRCNESRNPELFSAFHLSEPNVVVILSRREINSTGQLLNLLRRTEGSKGDVAECCCHTVGLPYLFPVPHALLLRDSCAKFIGNSNENPQH